ncbi:MAG: hypothetical protein A2211_01520 [Rhodanobacter sp. RIFOXYA1_FULL_67_6]|nr:hypothetical protein [Rhodanobacter denitrificans]OHC50923.1 MAG: hypothetical protein A2211_01520 [Rhodanobacter sp. RIFOXYA1_FULL_67_6]
MIEPYGTIIKSMLHEFRKLDLVIEQDTDYRIILANNYYSLTIATEKNYQPSVLACFRDTTSQEFEVGLSERILANQKFKANIKELEEIKEKYQLDARGGNEHARTSGIYIYAKVAIRQIFNFISEFSQEMLIENGPFRTEYQTREQLLLNDLGL